MQRGIRNRKLRMNGGGEGRGGLLFGAAVELFTLTATISASAYLVEKDVLSVGHAVLAGKISFAAAMVLGCWIAARKAEKGKFFRAVAVGTLLLLLTAAICAMLLDSEGMRLLPPLAVTAGGTLIGSLLGSRRRTVGYR